MVGRSIGTVGTSAFAAEALDLALPTRAIAGAALHTDPALRVVEHVADGIRGIGDTDGCDNGGGGDDDVFFSWCVVFVFLAVRESSG